MDQVVVPLWDNLYHSQVVSLLRKARHEVFVSSFKCEPKASPKARRVNEILSALLAAKHRGVDVRVLLNFQENKKSTSGINWYAALFLADRGLQVRYYPGGRVLHAKILVVDSCFVIVGSHNLSVLSHDRNVELSLLVKDPILAGDVRHGFTRLWDKALEFPGRQKKKGGS